MPHASIGGLSAIGFRVRKSWAPEDDEEEGDHKKPLHCQTKKSLSKTKKRRLPGKKKIFSIGTRPTTHKKKKESKSKSIQMRVSPSLRQLVQEARTSVNHQTQLSALQQLASRLASQQIDAADELLQRYLLPALLKTPADNTDSFVRAGAVECVALVGAFATRIEVLVNCGVDEVLVQAIYEASYPKNNTGVLLTAYSLARIAPTLLATHHPSRYDSIVAALASLSIMGRDEPNTPRIAALCLFSMAPKARLPSIDQLMAQLKDNSSVNLANARLLHGVTCVVSRAVQFMPETLAEAPSFGSLLSRLLLQKKTADIDSCRSWLLGRIVSCLVDRPDDPEQDQDMSLAAIWLARNMADASGEHLALLSAHGDLLQALDVAAKKSSDSIARITAETLLKRLCLE